MRVHERAALAGEALEQRLLLTSFEFDYRYDTNGFFDSQARKDVMELAGSIVASELGDDLDAIVPSGNNTWRADFTHPGNGTPQSLTDLSIPADQILVFVGARELGGTTVGRGGFGGWWASGSTAWINRIDYRGETGESQSTPTDHGPWGGDLTFDTSTNWHFGETVEGLAGNETDFLSVAIHEIYHVLGFGTASSWDAQVEGADFTGDESVAEYDGSGDVPLSNSRGHWAGGLFDDGRETALDPGITAGTRKLPTPLDRAALVDVGWEIDLGLDRDFGDAPSPYPTTTGSNGARHDLGSGLELGITADGEANGQPAASALGDDLDGFDDDDGVTFLDGFSPGGTVGVEVVATASGLLNAWIDFNRDGDWEDAGEQIFTDEQLGAGLNSLSLAVPQDAKAGETFARFRLDSGGGLSWNGSAADGEVEDYALEIVDGLAALNDSYSTSGTLTLPVLENDEPAGEVEVIGFTQPDAGTVTQTAPDALQFTPEGGYSGNTSFEYTIGFRQDKVTASDATSDDQFGNAVAVSGDLAIVGVREDDNGNGTNAGSAYIFRRSGNSWTQVTKIVAADGEAVDRFGFAVAIDGDTAVVSARMDDDTGTNSGSVYVFRQNEGGTDNWGQVAKITGSSNSAKDQFGHSVTIDGDTIAVGARLDDGQGTNSGSVYIFERDLGGTEAWAERIRLKPADISGGDQFGFSVDLSGDYLAVGSRKDDARGTDSGSAYVFERDAGGNDNWGEVNKLVPSEGRANDWFGQSIAIDGDVVVVGKPGRNGFNRVGEAWTFERSGGGQWDETDRLSAESGELMNQFGYSVDVSGETIVVGSRLEDSVAQNAGSVVVFEEDDGEWEPERVITATDAAQGDYFGQAVALSEERLVAGAPFDDDDGSKSGGVYFVDLRSDSATVTVNVTGGGAFARVAGRFSAAADSFADGSTGREAAADAQNVRSQSGGRCGCEACAAVIGPTQHVGDSREVRSAPKLVPQDSPAAVFTPLSSGQLRDIDSLFAGLVRRVR